MARYGVEGRRKIKLPPLQTSESHLVYFFWGIDLPRFTFEVSSDGIYGLVYTIAQVHNIDTSCHGLASFLKNCLCKYSCTSGTCFPSNKKQISVTQYFIRASSPYPS